MKGTLRRVTTGLNVYGGKGAETLRPRDVFVVLGVSLTDCYTIRVLTRLGLRYAYPSNIEAFTTEMPL